MMFELKGKSNHGKNRVREHGDVWEVQTSTLTPAPNKWMLMSVLTGDQRWVDKENDKNFEINEISC